MLSASSVQQCVYIHIWATQGIDYTRVYIGVVKYVVLLHDVKWILDFILSSYFKSIKHTNDYITTNMNWFIMI
jgi:myo-inositol-1-phosphate synthase